MKYVIQYTSYTDVHRYVVRNDYHSTSRRLSRAITFDTFDQAKKYRRQAVWRAHNTIIVAISEQELFKANLAGI